MGRQGLALHSPPTRAIYLNGEPKAHRGHTFNSPQLCLSSVAACLQTSRMASTLSTASSAARALSIQILHTEARPGWSLRDRVAPRNSLRKVTKSLRLVMRPCLSSVSWRDKHTRVSSCGNSLMPFSHTRKAASTSSPLGQVANSCCQACRDRATSARFGCHSIGDRVIWSSAQHAYKEGVTAPALCAALHNLSAYL
eukprot:scaffold225997_cov31-Tisochrysis_lutea.AAC.2